MQSPNAVLRVVAVCSLTIALLCLAGFTAQAQCPTARPVPVGPSLWISDQVLTPGTRAAVLTVRLATGGKPIAGIQTDISFPIESPVAVNRNGKPDCTVNPAINKESQAFAFRPPRCAGSACTGFRALVLSVQNTDPIPDGSVLFTCNINIAAGFIGNLNYWVTLLILSDPSGTRLDSVSQSNAAMICIPGGPTTTPQPTPTVVPPTATYLPNWTPSPTRSASVTPTSAVLTPSPDATALAQCPASLPAPVGPSIWVWDKVLTRESTTALLTARLATGGKEIAGIQTDISFPIESPVAVNKNGKPDCTVDPAINKESTSFAFQPPRCTGSACTGFRVLVLSLQNKDPIPDGSVLFTCNIDIAPGFAGNLSHTISGVGLSDPIGSRVTPVGQPDAAMICIPGGVWTPTPTQTPTQTLTPTRIGFCGETEETCTPTPSPPPPPPPNVLLFTCNVSINPSASGSLSYSFSGVIFADSNGRRIADAGNRDGLICVDDDTGSACPPTTAITAGPALWIPEEHVVAGATYTAIRVRLSLGDVAVWAIQSDITYPAAARISAKANGKPDCRVNPNLDKGASSFAYRPAGCSGADCTSVRAFVSSTESPGPVVPVGDCCDLDPPITTTPVVNPTNTATPAATPSASVTPITATPVVKATNTGTPTPSATVTRTSGALVPSPTVDPFTTTDEGCQISATSGRRSGALWLLFVAGLAILRRRSMDR